MISGDRDLVHATMENLRGAGVRCQQLTVSHAFHSPLIQPAIEAFAIRAASVPASAPKIAWISTATGASLTAPLDAQYWRDHGLNPVRFADGVKASGELGVTDFVELGPGGTLTRPSATMRSRRCAGLARFARQSPRRLERVDDEPRRSLSPRV